MSKPKTEAAMLRSVGSTEVYRDSQNTYFTYVGKMNETFKQVRDTVDSLYGKGVFDQLRGARTAFKMTTGTKRGTDRFTYCMTVPNSVADNLFG